MSVTQLSPAGLEFYVHYLCGSNRPENNNSETVILRKSTQAEWKEEKRKGGFSRSVVEIDHDTVLKEYRVLTNHDKIILLTSNWRALEQGERWEPANKALREVMTSSFREAHASKIISSDDPAWKIWARLFVSTLPVSWVFWLTDSSVSEEEKRVFVRNLMYELKGHLDHLESRYGRHSLILETYESYASSVLDKVYSLTANDQNKSPIFDTDNDGVVDTLDDFPVWVSYAKDSDHDSVPDEIDPEKENPKVWHSLKEGEVRVAYGRAIGSDTFITLRGGKLVVSALFYLTAQEITKEELEAQIPIWRKSLNKYLNEHQEKDPPDVVFEVDLRKKEELVDEFNGFAAKVVRESDVYHPSLLGLEMSTTTLAHEVMHAVAGLPDRYNKSSWNLPTFSPGVRYMNPPPDLMGDAVYGEEGTTLLAHDVRGMVAQARPITDESFDFISYAYDLFNNKK